MKLKNIFLSLVLSLLTFSNSFAMKPVGLVNGRSICYANAAIQMLFAIPKINKYLLTKNTDVSRKLLTLYTSYKEGTPNNELKLEIIKNIMGENNIANQSMFGFIEELFTQIDPEISMVNGTALEYIQNIFENLGIIVGVNENHIANIIHTGGHYYAEIKYKGQWYEVNDSIVTKIANPTEADLNNIIKPVFSISSVSVDDTNNYQNNLNQALNLEALHQEALQRARNLIRSENISENIYYFLENAHKAGLISQEEAGSFILNEENINMQGNLSAQGKESLAMIVSCNELMLQNIDIDNQNNGSDNQNNGSDQNNNYDRELKLALALSLSESENTSKEKSPQEEEVFQEELEPMRIALEVNGISSLGSLGLLNNLGFNNLNLDEITTSLADAPGSFISDNGVFSESGLEILAGILADINNIK